MREIEKEVAQRYNIEIKNAFNYRDGCILTTGDRKIFLKKCLLSPGRLLFVHGAKEHLYRHDFPNIDRYCCTLDGKPYFTFEQNIYSISEMAGGRECNLDSRNDVIAASKTLALLHKASTGYIPDQDSLIQDDLGKTPAYFFKRMSEVKRLKNLAKKRKYRFDYLFLDYVDYFYELGESVNKELSISCYKQTVAEARQKSGFCHHDYTYSNIIMGDSITAVINFDFCCFELKVYDVVNLLRRKMRKCNWDIREAAVILDHYCAAEPLSKDDFAILKLMLKFPQKFWRVSNQFYNSKRSWSERSYTLKLQESIDEIDNHRLFIEQFDRLF